MRHLKHKFQLGRKKEHREALMANLAAALIRHDRIRTTLAKAKALRPFVEKIITWAKEASTASPERSLHLRRLAMAKVRDKDAIAILFNEKATMFADRPGGYTRIYKLGTRIGDAAEMAVIQLIPADDEGSGKRRGKSAGKAAKATPAAVEAAEAAAAVEAEPEAAAVEAEPAATAVEEGPDSGTETAEPEKPATEKA
jgi:large subunit ribosomal protein L17